MKNPLHLLAVCFVSIPLFVPACNAPETAAEKPAMNEAKPSPNHEPRSDSKVADQSDYVFVWLKTGPHSAEHTADERKHIFEGHMANIKRLADAGQLIVAGPFAQGGHDKENRGVFVFDVRTLDAAQALVATDPGVQSGEFRPVMWPMRSSSTLRKSLELEKERLQGRTWTMEDGRAYQLVTVKDMHATEPALADLEKQGKVIWSGSFGGDADGWGVIILDAASAQDAATVMGPALKSMGECWIDPWFASKSLEGLRGLRGVH